MKKKKRGRGRREKQQWQQATETLFQIFFLSFMKLVLESVEKSFSETSLWEGKNVRALEAHAFLLINAEYQRAAI